MKMKSLIVIVISIVFLSGCMYPQDKLAQNQIPYQDQLESVQSAVDQFQKDNGGILPIQTKEATTPIYQKYLIDFNRIVPRYIAKAPGNSFENGGIFQYVLVDVEDNPTVKLLDLRITEKIRDIKLRISANGGYPPYKDKIGDQVFSLDYKKIGLKEEPFVVSPFSNVNLPLVVGTDGEIYVDYRIDLYKKLENKDVKNLLNKDIRYLLLEDSMFVPAYSLPYEVDATTKEPIFLNE
ncbi:hypothetical protein [Neobacillus sp. D3-1R]|uniref:hypothetical protein n=1 Tax=Neobacillus sp. D3-1R TaxID=3445778 RepID=UPI003F9FA335